MYMSSIKENLSHIQIRQFRDVNEINRWFGCFSSNCIGALGDAVDAIGVNGDGIGAIGESRDWIEAVVEDTDSIGAAFFWKLGVLSSDNVQVFEGSG